MYYLSENNPKYQGLAAALKSINLEYSFVDDSGIKVTDFCQSDNEISFANLVKQISKEIPTIGVCGNDKNIITAMLMQVFSNFKNVSYLMENEGFLKERSDYFCLAMHDEDILSYAPEYAIISSSGKMLARYINFSRNVKEAIICDINEVDNIILNDVDLPFFSYGIDEKADFSACNLNIDEDYDNCQFDLNFKSQYIASFTLPFTDKRLINASLSVIALATLNCFDARKIEISLSQYR